ncbi:hypothetical protein P7K49_019249 [Saguinus oedipus]|uniref:Maestro-like HEAT-repeats domain-containing protein n=1 Tax=Saguinus oedipus TaxID=9490 RepID=A0ABQ9UWS9_SAGOE|nr:hypothetical protein P7K49_019249 [Saguinus oedipus]
MESLTNSSTKLSRAGMQLQSKVMEEQDRDVLQIQEVVQSILEWLNSTLEPSTKEKTLQAMCSLACSNTQIILPMQLSELLPWDGYLPMAWSTFCSPGNPPLLPGPKTYIKVTMQGWFFSVLPLLDAHQATSPHPLDNYSLASLPLVPENWLFMGLRPV